MGGEHIWGSCLFFLNLLEVSSWFCQMSQMTSAYVGKWSFFSVYCLISFPECLYRSTRIPQSPGVCRQWLKNTDCWVSLYVSTVRFVVFHMWFGVWSFSFFFFPVYFWFQYLEHTFANGFVPCLKEPQWFLWCILLAAPWSGFCHSS